MIKFCRVQPAYKVSGAGADRTGLGVGVDDSNLGDSAKEDG